MARLGARGEEQKGEKTLPTVTGHSSNWSKSYKKATCLFLGACALALFPAVTLINTAGFPNISRLLPKREYISAHRPPPGYKTWMRFAIRNRCHLGAYTRIEKDLQPFRNAERPTAPSITRSQLEEAKKLNRTFAVTVKDGQVQIAPEDDYGFGDRVISLMSRFAKYLPDMEFVLNELDEARILPGEEQDPDARMAGPQCKNASEDLHHSGHLHGIISCRGDAEEYVEKRQLLPVFSQSKINECHADISYPNLNKVDPMLTPEQEFMIPAWHDRSDVLYFRGSASGGHFKTGANYSSSHRHRFVAMAMNHSHMDAGFTSYIQCDPEVCQEMQDIYGLSEPVDQIENFDHKYLMVPDGNTFVGRVRLFMSSGSLVFRSGLYGDWYDEWFLPDVHYVRVRLDYSDLEAKLQWAIDNDDEAHKIGQQGRHLALTRFRNEDMECYFFRLLLEYAALLQPG